MRQTLWKLMAMWRRSSLTTDANDEMQAHFEMEVEAGLKNGLSTEEATRRARLRVGLVAEGLEMRKDEFGFRWLDGMMGDLRNASRALLRSRGFGAVAVAVLAASVAINTLIFCILDGVILKPLPYKSPDQLVRIYDGGKTEPKFPMAIGRYLDYRANAKSLESLALYTGRDAEYSAGDGHPRQLAGLAITPEYFAVLGKPLQTGQGFADADAVPNVRKVIVSYRFWQDELHGDPAIVGKTVRLDRAPWTIVGVAPAGFQHVGGEYRSPLQGETVDIWTPLGIQYNDGDLRASHFCNAIARIRPGLTQAQAREDLNRVAALYTQRYRQFGQWTARIEPLLDEVNGKQSQVVWLLAAAGALVLLVACANIAGLCVARAVSRRKELSLRHALGANRWQLLRVGLAENLLIGLSGATVGLLLAWAGMPFLKQLLPADFPRLHEIGLTWMAAAFAASLATGTALLAGLLPANAGEALRADQRSTRDSRKMRMVLVAGEVALAGLLCAGALFLLRSYREILARDHGFRAGGTLTFQLAIPRNAAKLEALPRVFEELSQKIAAVPGVASVGASTNLPWSGYDENSNFELVGRRISNDDGGTTARFQAASPGYFEATGMRLVNGRVFEPVHDAKGQPPTVIINDALAKRYFPDGNAVGAVADVWGAKRQVVGVVAGIKDFPAELAAKPAFWFPLGQMPFGRVSFAVHTSKVDPASLTAAVTRAVHEVDPDLALADIRTLETRAAGAMASQRFALWLFQAFAGLALVLAAAGIYGLLAYLVQQRRKEIGIRVALGAGNTDVWRMVLTDGLKMAAAGAACCVVLIPVGGSLLQSFLYNVRAYDPVTIAVAPAALFVVALLASVGPAVSATAGDAAVALRED